MPINYEIKADEVNYVAQDVVIAEFLIRQLVLIIRNNKPTQRELARILQHKIETRSHFFNDDELRLMTAIKDSLTPNSAG